MQRRAPTGRGRRDRPPTCRSWTTSALFTLFTLNIKDSVVLLYLKQKNQFYLWVLPDLCGGIWRVYKITPSLWLIDHQSIAIKKSYNFHRSFALSVNFSSFPIKVIPIKLDEISDLRSDDQPQGRAEGESETQDRLKITKLILESWKPQKKHFSWIELILEENMKRIKKLLLKQVQCKRGSFKVRPGEAKN